MLGLSNPYGKFIGNEINYITEFLDSENPKNKSEPWVGRFEKAFAQKFNTRYAVAHNSGTGTLHSCLVATGVNDGDEVIMPAQTVSMVAFVALIQRAVPVFADIDPDTFNISPDDLAKKISDKTKAIIAVHMHGLPADMDAIMQIAGKHHIPVIEDSAQCMLGKYNGKIAGTIGDMASFSFEAKKHVSVGEAGMVITDNSDYATRIRKFGGLGYKTLSADAGLRQLLPSDFQNPHYKRHDMVGLNYRMPEICAALGLAQFERAEAMVQGRQEVARYYHDALDGCDWIVPQKIPAGSSHTYWTFTVRYEGEERHSLRWADFYDLYIKNGGDGFYGGLSLIYEELFMQHVGPFTKHLVSHYPAADDQFQYAKGLCPHAEALQPKMMQFKTNYRNIDEAKVKAEALFKTIRQVEG